MTLAQAANIKERYAAKSKAVFDLYNTIIKLYAAVSAGSLPGRDGRPQPINIPTIAGEYKSAIEQYRANEANIDPGDRDVFKGLLRNIYSLVALWALISRQASEEAVRATGEPGQEIAQTADEITTASREAGIIE